MQLMRGLGMIVVCGSVVACGTEGPTQGKSASENARATTEPAQKKAAMPEKDNEVRFFNQRATAVKVVFVIDHSGSMLDTFDFLRQELIQAVGRLSPQQSFNVVLVSDVVTAAVYPTLQTATPEVKKDFATKMAGVRAQGCICDQIDPFQRGFDAAFAMQPEVIYFLTDGHFDPKLVDVVTDLNKKAGGKVRVNTLAYVNHDPVYEEQLPEMAKKNNGQYKFVKEKDLGQE